MQIDRCLVLDTMEILSLYLGDSRLLDELFSRMDSTVAMERFISIAQMNDIKLPTLDEQGGYDD